MEFQNTMTNWMWLPEWEKENQSRCHLVYFRKTFVIREAPESFRIHISADSRYKLWVNGTLVEVGPVKGDMQVWYVDEVELAPYLVIGENVLAVEVLRYPTEHWKGNHGIFRTKMPGLYVLELTENTEYGISGSAFWKCKKEQDFSIVSESVSFAPLQILEERTGDAASAGWRFAGYDDEDWMPAVRYSLSEVPQALKAENLVSRTIPSILGKESCFDGLIGRRQTASDEETWEMMLAGKGVVRIAPHSHEYVEVSAGELMTGYLSLRLQGGSRTEIKILTSESYVLSDAQAPEDFRGPKKGNRLDWEHGQLAGFTDTYHVAGWGSENLPECYEPFWFRTFRFIRLEITTADEPLLLTGFDYKETGYPLAVRTWTDVSDETLAPIWDISLRTLHRCMHETYEDCPFYEQLQYTMDSRSQILYTYAVSADDRLARKCMDDFRRSVRENGMINCSYPNYESNIIPGFSIYYIMMLYDHMMYFGDSEFLRQHMEAINGILGFFDRNVDERGLVGKVGGMNGKGPYWSFIDWTIQWDATTGMPAAGNAGPITMESLLYIMGLTCAAKVMCYLGENRLAEDYLSRAEAVRSAVKKYCMDEEGMLTDGPGIAEYSQHCQVFAILTDTVSLENGKKNLHRTLGNGEKYTQCSVAMAFYLFRALEKVGLYAETKDAWNLWRNMVKNNMTTCVEASVKERSDCHAWGALALYELPSVVLGVRPAAPGYAKIAINPQPGYLTWAKGEVITPRGNVKVAWKLEENGELQLTYEAPESVEVVTRG